MKKKFSISIATLKKIATTFLLTIVISLLYSQNLVPNPSFEIYTNPPDGECEINLATGWSSFGWTPDYYNSTSNGDYKVPQNISGFQYAHTGNAYAGIGVYEMGSTARENIGIELIEPLKINNKYFVSFYVSLADSVTCYAINKLGALFSTISYSLPASYCQTNPYFSLLQPLNYAQIFDTTIIADKLNWTKISGSFIADSAYKYIAIGNFFDNSHISFIKVDPFCKYCGCAYYYVDDVCVTTDSIYNETWTGIKEAENKQNEINVYPNPATEFIYITTTILVNNLNVAIFNMLGEKILVQTISSQQNEINIDNLLPGIYYVQIQLSNKTFTKKIIKI